MIKHVIFDFDGTIVDSRYLAVELLNELAEKYHFRKIKDTEFEKLRNLSITERCRALHVPLYLIPLVVAELILKYQKSVNSLPTYAGIKDIISRLKEKGFKLSIISSNSTENIRLFLKRNHINNFDSIYSSNFITGKEGAIMTFLRNHNLKRDEVVYIGDECRDIIACKKNKVKIIAVSWGYDSIELLTGENPDYIARNPRELYNLIARA